MQLSSHLSQEVRCQPVKFNNSVALKEILKRNTCFRRFAPQTLTTIRKEKNSKTRYKMIEFNKGGELEDSQQDF